MEVRHNRLALAAALPESERVKGQTYLPTVAEQAAAARLVPLAIQVAAQELPVKVVLGLVVLEGMAGIQLSRVLRRETV